MPRQRRCAPPGCAYHVVNRGNDRRKIFRSDHDYEAFLRLMLRGKSRAPVQLYGVCLMPNHFHALIEPASEGALSAYFQWVLGRYAADFRSLTNTVGHGHVFQRRFWSHGVDDALHFLRVLRYIEANPSRASLVRSAEAWPWSSAALRPLPGQPVLDPLPFPLPTEWAALVNAPQSPGELEDIRHPEPRGRPVRGGASDGSEDPA